MTYKDSEYDIELSKILIGLINKGKNYQDNYFNYLMLKNKYSEIVLQSEDSINIIANTRTHGNYNRLCNIKLHGDEYIFNFNEFSIKNDTLNNILNEHVKSYKDLKNYAHDSVMTVNLPVYGKTRIRSASFRNGNGFDVIIRYLRLSNEFNIQNYSRIITSLLSDIEYIKSLSDVELNIIGNIYNHITDDRINFNNKCFSNCILLLQMLES